MGDKMKRKKLLVILGVVLAILILPVGVGVFYLDMKLNQMIVDDEVTEDFSSDNLQISDELSALKDKSEDRKKTINIGLFGVDCRNEGYEACRSDVMMVLSYNSHQNKATITSLVRDTYVDILDYGFTKLNHAYAYGGPAKAIQTINRNFDMDIENYFTVNFWAVEKIIDIIGGVEVEVSQDEVYYLNKWLDEMNGYAPDDKVVKGITTSGLQTLSGRQAVSYMRIRSVGNGDFERMERQRSVMIQALEQVQSLNMFDMISLVDQIIPYVKTNLDKSVIIEMMMNVLKSGIPTVSQYQLPTAELGSGQMINEVYYFVPSTLRENVVNWHHFIYDEDSYEPTSAVIEISGKMY